MIIRTVPRRRLPPHIAWLDYAVADTADIQNGDIIALPFRGGHTVGVVLEINAQPEILLSRIKTIDDIRLAGHIDTATLQAIVASAQLFHVPLPAFLLACMPEPPKRAFGVVSRETTDKRQPTAIVEHMLVRHRGGLAGVDVIVEFVQKHHVGSCVVLVPDVVRGNAVHAALRAAGEKPAFYHNQLNNGDAWRSWNSLTDGTARVLVTTRSGACAPAVNLQAVVVDSEDDDDFVQRDAFPYIDARMVAEQRAEAAQASLLLASEAPRFETAYRAHRAQWIMRAPTASQVAVSLVHLREEPNALSALRLSGALIDAAHSALQSGFSVLCFLNRAVESRSVRCGDCRRALACTVCQAVLAVRGRALWCFRCKKEWPFPALCPICQSPQLTERLPGIPRVAAALAEQLGHPVHTLMAGTETEQLPDGPVVVLATETIWKNAAPFVADREFRVVAALEADMGLTLPHARATEDVWATLMRLRNWAERCSGQLILQVWNDEHPVFASIRSGEPSPFLKTELTERAQYGYPPFGSRWRIFIPVAESAHGEERLMAAFPGSDCMAEEAVPSRRAVAGHRSFLLKLPAHIPPHFSSFPPTWIIEPDPIH